MMLFTEEYVSNLVNEIARLRARLARAEELLIESSGALSYHREQTRPIERTTVMLARIKAFLAEGGEHGQGH